MEKWASLRNSLLIFIAVEKETEIGLGSVDTVSK